MTDDLFKEPQTNEIVPKVEEIQKPEISKYEGSQKSEKPKVEFNIMSIILCVIVVILISVIVYLIVKKPKVNNELLTKTQEMYQETKKKNKELSDIVSDLEKKNKLLVESNESTIKTNSNLKSQLSDIQLQYTSTKDQLEEYKTKEAQALEVSGSKSSKSYAERKKERYDAINPPKKEIEDVKELPEEPAEIKLTGNESIAAQQQSMKKAMDEHLEEHEADIDQDVLSAIDM